MLACHTLHPTSYSLHLATECLLLATCYSLLTKVQRIPRYKLLLEELLKATPPTHPDRKPTEEALEQIGKIAHTVNEAIKRREAVEQACGGLVGLWVGW